MTCQRCTTVPELRGDRLWFWPPEGMIGRTVLDAAAAAGLAAVRGEGGAVRVETQDPGGFLQRLSGLLSQHELSDSRALLLDGRDPDLSDFGRVTTLGSLVAMAGARWLTDLLREKRVTSWLQPIVDVRNPARVEGYEFLLRGLGTDGRIISAGEMLAAASDPHLATVLDRIARITAVETAAGLDLSERLFINFMPRSIYDPAVCLRTTEAALERAGIRPAQVVFEVVESELIADYAHLRRIVDHYRSHGFGVALDDFGTGANNLEALLALRPDIIKVDRVLIVQAVADGVARRMLGQVVETAHAMGITVIAEGIEDASALAMVAELGVDLAQGYHLGRPAARPFVRPATVLAAAE